MGEVRLRRGIFQGDALLPLLFLTALIPITLILRKARSSHEFKNEGKINRLLLKDNLKLYAKLYNGSYVEKKIYIMKQSDTSMNQKV